MISVIASTVVTLALSTGTATASTHDTMAQAGKANDLHESYDAASKAREAGYDYDAIVKGCLRRDDKSMHTFFWLSKHAGFDAAPAQDHAVVTGDLLRRLGDKYFGRCLAKESHSVREMVRDNVLYDIGFGNTDITLRQITARYPMTFSDRHSKQPSKAHPSHPQKRVSRQAASHSRKHMVSKYAKQHRLHTSSRQGN